MTNHEIALTKQLAEARARCAELEAALVEAVNHAALLGTHVGLLEREYCAHAATIARLRAVADGGGT